MKQKTIHISFTKEDFDLYNDLMRESTLRLIPASTLCRYYMKKGKSFNQTPANASRTYETGKDTANSI